MLDHDGPHQRTFRTFDARSDEMHGVSRVRLFGELDTAGLSLLDVELGRAAQQGRRIVVLDLAELTFIDPAGLRAIVSVSDHLEKEGRVLCLLSPPMQCGETSG